MMMMIAPNSRACKKERKERGEEKGEHGRISEEEDENADYGGMVQPSRQRITA